MKLTKKYIAEVLNKVHTSLKVDAEATSFLITVVFKRINKFQIKKNTFLMPKWNQENILFYLKFVNNSRNNSKNFKKYKSLTSTEILDTFNASLKTRVLEAIKEVSRNNDVTENKSVEWIYEYLLASIFEYSGMEVNVQEKKYYIVSH